MCVRVCAQYYHALSSASEVRERWDELDTFAQTSLPSPYAAQRTIKRELLVVEERGGDVL
jgi:hypothetical protein